MFRGSCASGKELTMAGTRTVTHSLRFRKLGL
jgi:hypothetical protein